MTKTELQDQAAIIAAAARGPGAMCMVTDAESAMIAEDAIEALEAAGYLVVPMEPTEEMIEAGHRADGPSYFEHENYGAWLAERRGVEKRWRAMISVRPR
jgi:hypothetical protein